VAPPRRQHPQGAQSQRNQTQTSQTRAVDKVEGFVQDNEQQCQIRCACREASFACREASCEEVKKKIC